MEKVFPILTPLAVDPSHPFPYISPLSVNIGLMVHAPSEVKFIGRRKRSDSRFVRIKVPSVVPRLVPVGTSGTRFVLLEEIIEANIQALFPGMNPGPCHRFRVTRDADIEIREEEAQDLLSRDSGRIAPAKFWRAGSSGSLSGHAGGDDRVSDVFARSRSTTTFTFLMVHFIFRI